MTKTMTRTATNNAAAWKDYRTFRRNLLAIAALEERLAADFHEAATRRAGATATALDLAFLRQSCLALADTAGAALASVERIAAGVPADRQRDAKALVAAAAEHLPGLDAGARSAAIAHLDRHGGPAGLLQALGASLEARAARYRAGAGALAAGGDVAAKLADAGAAVFPRRGNAAPAPGGDDGAREFAAATAAAERAIAAGAAYPVALAERTVLAGRLFTRDPLGAIKFGISPGPWGDPEPILCFIAGLGWAVCVVIFLISVSSHGVDEDEEDDGGTTGGDE